MQLAVSFVGKTIYTGPHVVLVDALILARKRSGLTQAEVGARIGRDQTFISIIENRQRQVTVLEFVALVRAMGQDAAEVFATVADKIPENLKV